MSGMPEVPLIAAAISAALVLASRRAPAGVTLALIATAYLFAVGAFLLASRLPVKDSFDFHLPVFELIGQSLAAGLGFPEWLPVGGGIRTGVLQISLLYFLPHRLVGYALYAWTPLTPGEAYKIQYVVGVLLLAWGWWLVLARLTGCRIAASFGAVTLALGGTGITFHQEQVLATSYLVPWFLLAALQVETERRFLFAIALMFGLAATLHYPHILLISFLLFFVVSLLFHPASTTSKLGAALSPRLVPAVALFIIALGPLLYVAARLPELASPIRTLDGGTMVAGSVEDYWRLTLGAQPLSSAQPRQILEFVAPRFPPPRADDAAFFLGRTALVFAVMAVLLDFRRAVPILVLAVSFAFVSLGIHSPLAFVKALVGFSSEVMGMFRQWYHFFPMLNFCLSALAALGMTAAIGRLGGAFGRAGPVLLVALFAVQITELTLYAQRYIGQFTVADTPVRLLEVPEGEAPLWGITSRKTLLQYAERAALEDCCPEAVAAWPYLTAKVVSLGGGFAPQLAALRRGEAGRALADVPQGVLEDWLEPVDPADATGTAGPGTLEMTYRPDGIDVAVTAPAPALLVLPVNHALGLSARLNGGAVRIWRVNAALTGVLVPAGHSRVALRVVPDGYGWIAVSQVISVIVLFGLLAPASWRRRAAGRNKGTVYYF